MPPIGHTFEDAEDDADDGLGGKKLRWQCTKCGHTNVIKALTGVRLVAADAETDAVESFRSSYRRGPRPLRASTASAAFREAYNDGRRVTAHGQDDGDAAVALFEEVYGEASDLAVWRTCVAQFPPD